MPRERSMQLKFISKNEVKISVPPVFGLIFSQMPYVKGKLNYKANQRGRFSLNKVDDFLENNYSDFEARRQIELHRDAFLKTKYDFCSAMRIYSHIERSEQVKKSYPRSYARYCYDNILFNLDDSIEHRAEGVCLSQICDGQVDLGHGMKWRDDEKNCRDYSCS